MAGSEQVGAALAAAYGLRVHSVRPYGGGADPAATTWRADTWTGPLVVKVQTPAAAERAVAVAGLLAQLSEPALLDPVRSRAGHGWVELDDEALVAWPLRNGRNGFEQHQSPQVVQELGRLMRGVHDLDLHEAPLRLPIDGRDPRWRTAVLELVAAAPVGGDPVVERLSRLLQHHGDRLARLARAGNDLAAAADAGPEPERVLCHGDLHAGNVLVAPDGSLTVLDWDTAVLAPRERDLMFPGAGIGQTWTSAEYVAAFQHAYGPYAIDAALIAYYRCDRICEDATIYARSALDPDSPHRMADLATLESQFQPGDVVDRAERSLAAL